MKNKQVIAIGGGTGLSVLLRGLKKLPVDISAIVTMTDNGASSGRIRRAYGSLPPGDIRQCLVALSNDEELLTRLFNYRFPQGRGLTGHSFGNLFLLALTDITGNFEHAVQESSRILATQGKVIPSTLSNVNLAASLENGQTALGEADIPVLGHRSRIKKVFLIPTRVRANKKAVDAITSADVILIGPGSLYTSIIPNLLFSGVSEAIVKNKKARRIFICNVSTERGETERYTVEDHINALIRHSHPDLITDCLVNNRVIKSNGDKGELGSIHNITTQLKSYKDIRIISGNLIDSSLPLFHDAQKLQKAIASLI